MAAVAKASASISVLGPSGSGPFNLLHSLSVDGWVGPFSIVIPNGTVLQDIVVIGLQGLSTVEAFAITSDQAIIMNYNANTQGLPLNANGFQLFVDTILTVVRVTNTSGVGAAITYVAAGT